MDEQMKDTDGVKALSPCCYRLLTQTLAVILHPSDKSDTSLVVRGFYEALSGTDGACFALDWWLSSDSKYLDASSKLETEHNVHFKD